MTVEICIAACRSNGFPYAGLQWQIECYCGDEPLRGFQWAWKDKCYDRCAGNSNQICGGSGAMSLYSTNIRHFDGLCIYDFPQRRVLNELVVVGETNMTIENCDLVCQGLNKFMRND